MQPESTAALLKVWRTANEERLKEWDVDLSLYGKFDMAGVKDGDPEPCPRTWDEKRQRWSDEWKKQEYDYEIKETEKEFDLQKERMSEGIPAPKKMIEIFDKGIQDPLYATSALAEILEQAYKTEHFQTLINIDGMSNFFRPSNIDSSRYENIRGTRGRIPPYDLASVRLLMRHDGHLGRNVFKLGSSTQYEFFNHMATPEQLRLQDGYAIHVDKLTLNDFRNFVMYCMSTGRIDTKQEEWQVEQWWAQTDGNFSNFSLNWRNYRNFHNNFI